MLGIIGIVCALMYLGHILYLAFINTRYGRDCAPNNSDPDAAWG